MSFDKNYSYTQQSPDFEKAEVDLLKESLRRSHKERFLMATLLYKIQQTMKRAKITRKPFITGCLETE